MGVLEGKNILIMGIRNSKSTAWGIAQSAHEQGARLIFTYHGEKEMVAIEELTKNFKNCILLKCDVENEVEVKATFSKIKEEVKTLDGLVHCISHTDKNELKKEFLDTSRDGYIRSMDVTSYSLILISKYAKDLMLDGGSIVTISYYAANKVMTGYNLIGAAKAALEANVRYLACEMGPMGIRVNCVSSGPIKTVTTREINDFNTMLETVERRSPLRKVVTPREIGDATAFLLSNLSSGITGTTLYVDSGYHIMGI